VETLPLDVDTYRPKMREDIFLALNRVAAHKPNGPLPEGAKVHSKDIAKATGTTPLPAEVPRVLGITGFSRSGKDTVPNYLLRTYAGVTRFAYSDPIIDEVNIFLTPHGYHIDQESKTEPHFRHLLQIFGSGRRYEDPDYWNTPIIETVRGLRDVGTRLTIISGLRFTVDPDTGEISDRDLTTVYAVEGEIWNVDRPGLQDSGVAAHYNEAGLATMGPKDFDGWLVNGVEGDLEACYENLEALLRDEKQPHIPVGYPYTAEQLWEFARRS
jgi:hypothetical protein